MGMYNEVYANCPECNRKCMIQIPQIVLGFGEFDLDNLQTFWSLTDDKIEQIRDCIKKEFFFCKECGCYFNPLQKDRASRIEEILFEKMET